MQVKTLARTAREREWRIAGASVTQLTRNEHLAPKRKPAIYLTLVGKYIRSVNMYTSADSR